MPFDLINFFPCLVTEGVQGAIGKPLVFSCGSIPDYKKSTRILQVDYLESGGDLLSRAVSSQVPSALKGLTSVFGMGTGGTPSSLPPEMVSIFESPFILYHWTSLPAIPRSFFGTTGPFRLPFLPLPGPSECIRTLTTAQLLRFSFLTILFN